MSDSLPAFNLKLSPIDEEHCTVVGIFVGQQSAVRHVPHYQISSALAVDMQVSKAHRSLGADQYQVELTVAVSLQQENGAPALSAAVTLEAIAVASGLTEEELVYQLTRALPARLFSHARVQIEALTRDSGYAAVTLPPAALEPTVLGVAS